MIIEKMNVRLSEKEEVEQYYYINSKGFVTLIYPFYEDEL
jgi:hypothetical protein